jgi:CRAL/TRIO domain
MLGENYPERLYRCFILNVPYFFSVLWRMVEPMLNETTCRKIRVFGNMQVCAAVGNVQLRCASFRRCRVW